jgi:hypothetical protein
MNVSIAAIAIPLKLLIISFFLGQSVIIRREKKRDTRSLPKDLGETARWMDTQLDQYREGLLHKVGGEIFINNWQCFLGHNDSKGRLLD